ncbi:MAG: hypothetical protein JO063_09695 [Pseudonocardiales bacterium]|nr:hypothetical protein [Pseudonocardiales bacterium]MBV9031451.1 hypothetical protein [Pseudonocardiales bacterium]MBW0010370.1 hypothetical protein [Pseudonocardiales bacterium]
MSVKMVRWMSRWPLPLALCGTLISLLFATAVDASASVPTTYCGGRSYTYIVKNYARGAVALPLRCGTSTWGFTHITTRWNETFDANIALTISRGEEVTDRQDDGGSAIYALFNDNCRELFRVIYNGGAYRGNDVRPQGIITAYDKSITPVSYATPDSAASNVTAASSSYRTNCAVIQNI